MITEEFENGIIRGFFLGFDDNSGKQGRNFIFEINVELSFGEIVIEMNPRKIPQLLKILKINDINELINTPIIMAKTNYRPKWIQHFLASYTDKPFPVNDGEYYGSNLYIEYPVNDIADFLPKETKKPELGEKPDMSNDIDYKGLLERIKTPYNVDITSNKGNSKSDDFIDAYACWGKSDVYGDMIEKLKLKFDE